MDGQGAASYPNPHGGVYPLAGQAHATKLVCQKLNGGPAPTPCAVNCFLGSHDVGGVYCQFGSDNIGVLWHRDTGKNNQQ